MGKPYGFGNSKGPTNPIPGGHYDPTISAQI